jgi:hypothetical protein
MLAETRCNMPRKPEPETLLSYWKMPGLIKPL